MLKLEQEKKMVAEMKDKWKLEYEKEQARKARVEIKKNAEMVKLPETQKLKRVKPKPKKEKENENEDEDEDEDDEVKPFIKRVMPKSKKKYVESDADSTDTELIKDKMRKVKEIDAVLQPRVENPYMRLLEKYYKR
jgi:hypothetical protein